LAGTTPPPVSTYWSRARGTIPSTSARRATIWDLPAAVGEMRRLCNREHAVFSVLLPCEGGLLYTLAGRVLAQRILEKRHKQFYSWFIQREHVDRPDEISTI
jgi:hypothetical protein